MTDDQIDQLEHLLMTYMLTGLSLSKRDMIKQILRHLRMTRSKRRQLEKGMKT